MTNYCIFKLYCIIFHIYLLWLDFSIKIWNYMYLQVICASVVIFRLVSSCFDPIIQGNRNNIVVLGTDLPGFFHFELKTFCHDVSWKLIIYLNKYEAWSDLGIISILLILHVVVMKIVQPTFLLKPIRRRYILSDGNSCYSS